MVLFESFIYSWWNNSSSLIWKVTHFPKIAQPQTLVLKNWAGSHEDRLRAYSFCPVFLFRFINRNRNKRAQKERLSFERNNFHGNKKMADCLISNWKGKVRKHYTRTKFERKTRAIFSTDSLSLSTPLSAAVLTAVLFEGKSGEKMRNKTRNSLLCFP